MKEIKKYIITGIIFVSILGTLFHFAYKFSGNNTIVGIFTPINESIWEHTKLIFFPMLLYSLLRRKSSLQYPCISSAMALGSVIGVILIIVLFYTYSGIIGFNVAFVDITIFYISVIISFYIAYKTAMSCKSNNTVFQTIQIVMICLFVIFTFFPPDIPLFANP